ncbi:MAG: hypothetical protein IJK52_01850 [Oscillospiraceae bacterium]|nr:hypothetical protein [Oscillospiraceae bacterium]
MASATLAAVGGATVIAATLAACGIYPYASAGEGSFGEWGARALTDLLTKYNEAHIESAIRMEQVRAYVVGRTLAVGREVWDRLRDFAAWVRDTYALTDNQTGQQLGIFDNPAPCYNFSGFSDSDAYAYIFANGVPLASDGTRFMVSASADIPRLLPFIRGYHLYIGSDYFDLFNNRRVSPVFACSATRGSSLDRGGASYGAYGGVTYYWCYNPTQIYFSDVSMYSLPVCPENVSIPVFLSSLFASYRPAFSGITADTSTISVPAALPVEDDSEFVGLSVYPGTVSGVTDIPATAMTPEAVEEIIQQGVMSRERPVVRPVEIEVEAGTTVDTETGEVATESAEPIVISPTTIPLQASDYAIPALSSVFPFSIPWDIMRIWQALGAEPRFPLQDFSLALDVPLLFGESPPVVRFDLASYPEAVSAKMDEVAGVVRYSLLLVACVGFLIFISQFIKW